MTPEGVSVAVIDALEAVGFEYMLVGSFSSNHYGIPRSTQDVDFVIEMGGHSIRELAARLGADFKLDPQASFETITGTMRFIFQAIPIPFKVEVFRLSSDPHDQSRFQRRLRLNLPALERQAWLPTAEDVIVTKLRWSLHGARAKDLEDARDVIAVRGDRLDWTYICRWSRGLG